MVAEKYAVRLSSEGRGQLERLIRSGQRSARVINRARILLKSDEGWSAPQVAAALDTSQRTVYRAKRRYAEEGWRESSKTGSRPTDTGSLMTRGRPT